MSKSNGTAPKRVVRHYTETERLGLMFLAVQHGEAWVEREHKVPAPTLSTWLSKWGGLEAARSWQEQATRGDYLLVVRAFYDEALKRMGLLSNKQIVATVHRLIEAQATSASGANVVGVAAAQAISEVRVIVEDNRT